VTAVVYKINYLS